MYKTPKFKGDENSYLFLADGHLFQKCERWDNPLWRMRGFDSPEAHVEGFVANWNKVCDDNSVVFHLGDFVFQDPKAENFWNVISRLKFRSLNLLAGNHNSGQRKAYLDVLYKDFPSFEGTDGEVYPLRANAGFNTGRTVIFWPEYLEVYINSTALVLCHYPIVSFNGQAESNVYHLSGHCHGSLPLTNKDTGSGRRLDVGFDSFARPISLTEVKAHLAGRDLAILDHHKPANHRNQPQ